MYSFNVLFRQLPLNNYQIYKDSPILSSVSNVLLQIIFKSSNLNDVGCHAKCGDTKLDKHDMCKQIVSAHLSSDNLSVSFRSNDGYIKRSSFDF